MLHLVLTAVQSMSGFGGCWTAKIGAGGIGSKQGIGKWLLLRGIGIPDAYEGVLLILYNSLNFLCFSVFSSSWMIILEYLRA